MMPRLITALLLLIACPLAVADSLDMSLNNNAVAFTLNTSAASLVSGNTDLHLGLLYNDSMNTLADAGLIVKADEGDTSEMTLAVGTKVLVGIIKNYMPGTTQNVDAVVIGGELGYVFPAVKQLSAAFDYFVGPKISTFGDANRANQWGLHLDYEVSPGTKAYVEYRETNFGITSTGQTAALDSGTYVGVKLAF